MADLPSHPDTDEDPSVQAGRESHRGTPRWVSVVGIIVAVVLVLGFVVLHLTGTLGPGSHQP